MVFFKDLVEDGRKYVERDSRAAEDDGIDDLSADDDGSSDKADE